MRDRRSCGILEADFLDPAPRPPGNDTKFVQEVSKIMDTFRGLVTRAEEWKGSSIRDDAGVGADEPGSRCGLEIDCLRLPPVENTRI